MYYIIEPKNPNVLDMMNRMNLLYHLNRVESINRFRIHSYILDCPLYSNENKLEFRTFLEKNFKLKFICYKFYFKLKNNISRYANDTDIFQQPFNNDKTITIHKKEFIWRFSLEDINSIITKSLTFSNSFFPNPKFPKNPYTNIIFNILELHQIHKQLNHFNSYNLYFELFKKYHFNLKAFEFHCFQMLKRDIIINTVNNFIAKEEEFEYCIEDIFYCCKLHSKNICFKCIKNIISENKNALKDIKQIMIQYNLYHNDNNINKMIDDFITCYYNKNNCQCIQTFDDITYVEFNIGTNY